MLLSSATKWAIDHIYNLGIIDNPFKISGIDTPLIIGAHGSQFTRSGLNTAMARLKVLMKDKGLIHVLRDKLKKSAYGSRG